MNRTFKKVKLEKDGKSLFIDFAHGSDSDKRIRKEQPHEDLTNKFIKFIPHLLFTIGLKKPTNDTQAWFDDYEFLQDPIFEAVNVTGVAISGKDGEYVKILGTFTNAKKEVTPLNSPIIYIEDNTVNAYNLLPIFKENFEGLLEEVEKYLDGKYAPSNQAQLDF